MENVVLVVHLILALSLIAIVLLQRSEGGGLGMGGGGGGAMSARGAATALGKATWIIAGLFICTSIGLTIIAAEKSAGSSVLDRITDQPTVLEEPTANGDATGLEGLDLLPPTAAESGPVVPVVPAAPTATDTPAPEAAPADATAPASTADGN